MFVRFLINPLSFFLTQFKLLNRLSVFYSFLFKSFTVSRYLLLESRFSVYLANPSLGLAHHTISSTKSSSIMSSLLSQSDQENLIEKLQIFEIQGRDKRGRIILRIIGKFFPARIVSFDVLKKHLEERIFPRLENGPFSVLYVHTDVQRTENFPGISALRSIYDSIPINVRQNLEAVYFVHPGLQARLFLATFGRLMFSGGFYEKLRYINNLNFLWDHVRRNEIEIPDFVSDHDEDLEYRPIIDYGLESDYPRVFGAPAVDSPAPMYSMRCIS